MPRHGLGLGLDVIQAVAAGGGGDGADLKTELACWWALDEASGDRADSHTNGYTLTDNNTVGVTTAKIGANAGLWDASSNEHLDRANGAEAWRMGLKDLTVGAWIKPTGFATGANQWLVGTGVATGTEQGYLCGFNSTGSRPEIRINNGTSAINRFISWGTEPTDGVWYFVLFEWDRSADMSVWKNDVEELSPLDISSFESDDILSVSKLTVGRFMINDSQHLDAGVDELFIYNRLLTAAEKTWLYNSGSGRSYSEIG